MNFDLKEFISSTMILFAIIDIVGNIPLIVLLREKYKVIESEKASFVSLIIMVVFLFVGEVLLNLLGVDINSFAVAGSIIILFLAYNWNAIFAKWDDTSIYFLPNVTKIYMLVVFVLYAGYRGIIRPHQLKVKLSFLLPWRWLGVCFVGLCLDLAKTPGLSWGAILILYRRIRGIRGCFKIRKKPDL